MGAGAGKAPSLMNIQMELRKCCNHPFMVRGVEDHEVDNIVGSMMEEAQKEVRRFCVVRTTQDLTSHTVAKHKKYGYTVLQFMFFFFFKQD